MKRAASARLKAAFADNLWLMPATTAAVAATVAKLLAWVDRNLRPSSEAWYLFGGQADSAREVLSTIASSLMMFISVVFSITILVLQLASSQFSPRVLRTFLSNKVTRAAMVIFIGSFVYALTLLTEVRDNGADTPGFVPALSIFVAFVLVLTSVGFFVRYIHEMAHSIRAVHIIRQVGDETRRTIDRLYPDESSRSPLIVADAPTTEGGFVVPNGDYPGIVTTIDDDSLLQLARKHDVTIEVLREVGDFVPRQAPLFRVTGSKEIDGDELMTCVALGEERIPGVDPMFGFRQLVDIAVRALSPGVNDPTTAVQALDQIHDLLRALARKRFPSRWLRDDAGLVRVVQRPFGWDAYLHLAFDEIRLYGRTSIHVVKRVRDIIEDLEAVAPPHRASALRRQRELLDRAVREGFPDSRERALASAPEAQDA